MPVFPSGTVTFLFTDIEGSTALWERDRPAMAQAVARHHDRLRTAIEAHDGVLFKRVGDAAQAAFPAAPRALAAAVTAQRALLSESWTDPPGPLRVRMALHVGEADPRDGDYLAPALNRLSRLVSAGHGGQILLTQAAQHLVRDALPATVSLRELGVHQLRDLPEPEVVFQVVVPGWPDRFPPLRTLPRHLTNVTVPPTALVGRESEFADVQRLFDEGNRLVTLTGPGGTGKTRLALGVAVEALDRYPDGVCFVDLAPIRDAFDVVPAVAGVLGIRENPGESVRETLNRALAQQRMLLVLDNYEQVMAAAEDAAALLAACPHLHLLVTSREPLRVRAERVVPIAPLPLPDARQPVTRDVLTQSPSVALFVERAQAADPSFTLTDENGPVVADICRRLDGLPLAIELAAARVRLLPPRALLARLERSLPLLTSGARDAPSRQRTLRDTIAWSFDLLSLEEQALFRRLSVFVGGWTLEAAEAVTSPHRELDVLGGLGSLVDRSLAQRDERSGDDPRYALLETIREYGVERLAASGEEGQTRERHATWILALAEQAQPELLEANQQTWWLRLEAERPNIRAALAWFEKAGDAERAQRLAGALTPFWWMRGHLHEGQEWLRRALAVPGTSSPPAQALALLGSATLGWFRGENAAAQAMAEEALTIAQNGSFAFGVALAQQTLAVIAWMQGDHERALTLGEEAIARLREEAQSPGLLAVVLSDMGTIALRGGDLARGKRWSDEGLALHRALGNRWFIAGVLSDLGVVAHDQDDLVVAARHYAESARLFQELDDPAYIASPLAGLAAIAVRHNQPEVAARLLGVAAALREASGATVWATERERDAQTAAAARALLGEEVYARALAEGHNLPLALAMHEAMEIAGGVVGSQAPTSG